MNKIARIMYILLAAAMLLSFAACSSETVAAAVESPSQQPTAESENLWHSVTLIDQMGREVTIEKRPERIVSGYYITSSLLIALNCADRLVGIEESAAKRNIYSLAAPELLNLPNVGSAKNFNLESCIALEPDLVILPKKLAEPAETLVGMGIPVILVNPESSELLKEAVQLVGNAVGETEKADALLAYYSEAEKDMQALTSELKEPTVYLAGNSDMLLTATSKMYQNTLIETAGAVNVAAELEDTYWATVSYEQLMIWDPDYIIIAPEAAYTVEDVLSAPQLESLTAVKEGRVYAMPSAFEAWDSPVPSGVLGEKWLCSLLHGEAYSFDTMKSEAADFYKTFYGFDINTEALTQ